MREIDQRVRAEATLWRNAFFASGVAVGSFVIFVAGGWVLSWMPEPHPILRAALTFLSMAGLAGAFVFGLLAMWAWFRIVLVALGRAFRGGRR